MKIIRNIPQVIKIYRSLKYLNEYKKEIDSGRISGDIKKEKENILKATKTWGSKLSEMIGVEITVSGIENLPDCLDASMTMRFLFLFSRRVQEAVALLWENSKKDL